MQQIVPITNPPREAGSFWTPRSFAWILATAWALGTGCSPHEIQVYSVPKEKDAPPPMAGSGDPHGGQAMEMPKWRTPPSWKPLGPGRMSIASFSIEGDNGSSAEIAVFPFRGKGAPDIDFLNIWRKNLGLNSLTPDTLPSITETVRIAGAEAKLYNVGGALPAGQAEPKDKILVAVQARAGTTWFYKLQGESTVVSREKAAFVTFLSSTEFQQTEASSGMMAGGGNGGSTAGSGSVDTSGLLPKWEVPGGWQQQPTPQMLLAKFQAKGESAAFTEVTVSAFPGDAGGLLANVNRWRNQLGLKSIDDNELKSSSSQVQVQGKQAVVVEMSGTDARSGRPAKLVGAIFSHGGQTWFFKMMGDTQVSESQKPSFLKFVQSIQFPDA